MGLRFGLQRADQPNRAAPLFIETGQNPPEEIPVIKANLVLDVKRLVPEHLDGRGHRQLQEAGQIIVVDQWEDEALNCPRLHRPEEFRKNRPLSLFRSAVHKDGNFDSQTFQLLFQATLEAADVASLLVDPNIRGIVVDSHAVERQPTLPHICRRTVKPVQKPLLHEFVQGRMDRGFTGLPKLGKFDRRGQLGLRGDLAREDLLPEIVGNRPVGNLRLTNLKITELFFHNAETAGSSRNNIVYTNCLQGFQVSIERGFGTPKVGPREETQRSG